MIASGPTRKLAGRAGVYVLPVQRGADPHGFLGEVQGIQGLGKNVSEVAEEIFETLLRLSPTKKALLEAVVVGFERSESFKVARQNISLLETSTKYTGVAAATDRGSRPLQ